VHDDTQLVHNPTRADQEFLPASTFKIPNSLIALETGAIADEREVLKWDGQKRSVPEWNKDHDMRTAIAVSAVWFYQELVRRIGAKRMQEWIDRIGYGNRDVSGGIDQFWLTGGLRITARQQIEFIRRLYTDELPFSARTLRIVKDILVLEKTAEYVLRGKTGLAGAGRPGVGWFVGWIERGDRAWIFASNVAMKPETDIALRKAVALEILAGLRLIPRT
jgi:beta-lactamase class D